MLHPLLYPVGIEPLLHYLNNWEAKMKGGGGGYIIYFRKNDFLQLPKVLPTSKVPTQLTTFKTNHSFTQTTIREYINKQ